MTTKRHDLYKKVRVENNKEIDLLTSKITDMMFENYDVYTIQQFVEHRPDLISFIHYGTVEYWWLILEINDIIDPFSELYTGRDIMIPALPEYYIFYNINSVVEQDREIYDQRKII